jgi:hypothetical protein
VPTLLAATVVGVCAWFELLPLQWLVWGAWGMAIFSVANLAVAVVLDRKVIMDQPV